MTAATTTYARRRIKKRSSAYRLCTVPSSSSKILSLKEETIFFTFETRTSRRNVTKLIYGARMYILSRCAKVEISNVPRAAGIFICCGSGVYHEHRWQGPRHLLLACLATPSRVDAKTNSSPTSLSFSALGAGFEDPPTTTSCACLVFLGDVASAHRSFGASVCLVTLTAASSPSRHGGLEEDFVELHQGAFAPERRDSGAGEGQCELPEPAFMSLLSQEPPGGDPPEADEEDCDGELGETLVEPKEVLLPADDFVLVELVGLLAQVSVGPFERGTSWPRHSLRRKTSQKNCRLHVGSSNIRPMCIWVVDFAS